MSERPEPGKITDLLKAASAGDVSASDELIRIVEADLKRVARRQMAAEREGHTLQPTALVNEMFLKLFQPPGGEGGAWKLKDLDLKSRAHFLGLAAVQMRKILVEHARKKRAEKRDFGVRVPIDDANPADSGAARGHQFDELDEQLTLLATKDANAARVVELKFFGGLTDEETAEAMGRSFAKVRRDWEFARAWLRQRMQAA